MELNYPTLTPALSRPAGEGGHYLVGGACRGLKGQERWPTTPLFIRYHASFVKPSILRLRIPVIFLVALLPVISGHAATDRALTLDEFFPRR